jgi:hypothetical protein
MFDFRYHALSLAAVLIALVVGLLLGVAVGDQGLVSSAEHKLRADLRSDVTRARADSAQLRKELDLHLRFEQLTLGRLVSERLAGRRVAVLFLHERSDSVYDHVRDSVQKADGELSLVGTIRRPLNLQDIGKAAFGTQYSDVANDPSLVDDLGRRLGTQIVRGGRLIGALRGAVLQATSGGIGPSEAIVVVRTPGERLDGDQLQIADQFTDGLIEGMKSAGVPVVGVEERSTDPSQVPWYRKHGLTSVDDVDEVPGQASLVYALAGSADGAYGVKSTRDAFIPDALVRTP